MSEPWPPRQAAADVTRKGSPAGPGEAAAVTEPRRPAWQGLSRDSDIMYPDLGQATVT